MKVINIKTGKTEDIAPLIPEAKETFSWRCNRCGQKHTMLKPRPPIFDMTDNGLKYSNPPCQDL